MSKFPGVTAETMNVKRNHCQGKGLGKQQSGEWWGTREFIREIAKNGALRRQGFKCRRKTGGGEIAVRMSEKVMRN